MTIEKEGLRLPEPKEDRLAEHLNELRRCCLAGLPDGLVVLSVDAFEEQTAEGYADYDDAALFTARDDTNGVRWAVLESWADATGHGCQCGAEVSFHPDRDTAIRLGLSDRGRKLLGVEIV